MTKNEKRERKKKKEKHKNWRMENWKWKKIHENWKTKKVQKRDIILKRENTIKKRKLVYKMKNLFLNWFSIIQKTGNQFKEWKSTKKGEIIISVIFAHFSSFSKRNKKKLIIGQTSRKYSWWEVEIWAKNIKIPRFAKEKNHTYYRSKKSERYSIKSRKIPKYITKKLLNHGYYHP